MYEVAPKYSSLIHPPHRGPLLLISGLITLLWNVSSCVYASEFTIGNQLPEVSGLIGIDGMEWSSKSQADAKVLIVVFTCNKCPYSVDYEDRLNALHSQCVDSDGKVRLLVVNSNTGRNESLPEMTKRAKQKQFRFVYVKDGDQSFARSVGAVYTPECFVFDQDRHLVYKGALDDSTTETKVKVNYVNDAVSAVLAGVPVRKPKAGARGCAIRFKRHRPENRKP